MAGETFKGISFPFRISSASGGVETAKVDERDSTLIRQSIIQIIGTNLGERLIEKGFGSSLRDFVFENSDEALQQAIAYSLIKALTDFEPRVRVKELTFSEDDQDEGKLVINLGYVIRLTGREDAFAFAL